MSHSNWEVFRHFVKSIVSCVHFDEDCVCDERVEKYAEDKNTESWHCYCTCKKCGEKNIKKNMTFSKLYLNALRAAGVE